MKGQHRMTVWTQRLLALALLWLTGGCATISLSEEIDSDQIFERHSLASIERVEWASRLPDDTLMICITGTTINKYDRAGNLARFTIRVDNLADARPAEGGQVTAPLMTLEVSPDRVFKGCGSNPAGAALAVDKITIGDQAVAGDGVWRGWDRTILDRHEADDLTETVYDVRTVSAGGFIYYSPGKQAGGTSQLYRFTTRHAEAVDRPALKYFYPVTVAIDIVTLPIQYVGILLVTAVGEFPPP